MKILAILLINLFFLPIFLTIYVIARFFLSLSISFPPISSGEYCIVGIIIFVLEFYGGIITVAITDYKLNHPEQFPPDKKD